VRTRSIACFALGAGLAVPALQAQSPDPWHVLILNGGTPFVPGAAVQEEAMRMALLAGASRPVEFHAEYLDSISFDTSRFEAELLALLRKKHEGLRIDLVMAIGPDALAFAERHRDRMWPEASIVFFSVSRPTVEGKPPGPHTTGVLVAFDEAGTLELARRLQPEARRLVLVSGASDYDKSWEPGLREAVRRHGEGLVVLYLLGEPLPDVLRTLAELPRDAIVLYTTIGRDGRGEPYVPRNVAEELARVSAAPVYAIVETQLGTGVVGGSMPGLAAGGQRAGALGLRVLEGEKAGDIPVQAPPPPRAMVDWRQLRRHGISESALPPGIVVRFRSQSVWEEYRGYIAAAVLALVVQTALIAALLVQSRRRRRAELDAQRQRAELAHASRLSAVGQLTASIAHEINQPLGAILSNAEAAEMFLDADPPRLDRVRQILADIGHEDRRASEVIRHVRSLLRKAPPEMQPLALNDVARDVLDLVRGDAERRGIALQVELGGPLPAIRGDRVQLQQALLNLILNSMDALQGGNGEGRIVVSTRAEKEAVELAVADNGPGIPAERLPHVFDSFYTSKKDGMGLGLSIVHSIVEAHGGRIEAGHSGGGGAVFRLRLPAALLAEAPASAV
jgi:signal transduction histidine kinase